MERKCHENANSINSLASKAIKNCEHDEKEDRTSFRVTLDDAVDTLADVKVDEFARKVTAEFQKPKPFGSMMAKRNFQDAFPAKGYSRFNRNKNRIPQGKGPKATSKFRACGEPNHWYKDPECIYKVMRSLVEGKEVDRRVIYNQSNEVQSIFNEARNSNGKVEINAIVEVIGDAKMSKPGNSQNIANASKSYFR